ncbi:MAG TPA: FAD binding domain-containing protein [Bryobacteraceae bacterium]|jgi:xanthine dehydrogenase YagS FAD-binding subunit|nr:FAD binding domain-containing protein [Bryobacteraceae bacterium]
MERFEYTSPKTVKDATAMLGASWNDAQVLAGGTDLISMMKDFVASPKRVVNIKGISELGGISKTSAGVRIGATVTLDDLTLNHLIRTEFPSLVTAALGVSSPQIRNMGTVAGDLCQRPRCWYFRNGHGLFAMQDGKSLIPNGENRYHAIFGGNPAYFVSASSLGPALAALGSHVKLVSPSGARTVAVEKFFVIPKTENDREIDLHPNEIVTEIVIPSSAGMFWHATYEIREKQALDWPLATASVAVMTGPGNKVVSARIMLGHVAPIPWRASAAEKTIAGKSIDEASAEQAAAAAVEGAQPLSQNGYKVQLAKVAVKRALLAAAQKA